MSDINQVEKNNLLLAKIKDKIEISKTKNRIAYSDFMQLSDLSIVKKFIKENHITNYIFFGGIENANRQCIAFYPDKLDEEIAMNAIQKEFSVIHIVLPSELEYAHGEYLSGLMKIGMVREKFGDIIVRTKESDGYAGADVICFKSIEKTILDNLPFLTRFKKASISVIEVNQIQPKVEQYDFIKIIVTSNRLDNFVAELAHCSRGIAQEYLKAGKVFINGINEYKDSKKLGVGDIITIRGKGKFIFDSILGETRSNRINILIKKYK